MLHFYPARALTSVLKDLLGGETYFLFYSSISMTWQMSCLVWSPERGGLPFLNRALTGSAAWSLRLPQSLLQPLPKAPKDHFLKPAANTFPNTTKCVFGDKLSHLILKY